MIDADLSRMVAAACFHANADPDTRARAWSALGRAGGAQSVAALPSWLQVMVLEAAGNPGLESKDAHWDEAEHPRDGHGRFIEKGARLRILLTGQEIGTAVGTAGEGKVVVRGLNGHEVTTESRLLEQVPDGTPAPEVPTGKPDGAPNGIAVPADSGLPSWADGALTGDDAELSLLRSQPEIELEDPYSESGFTAEGEAQDYYTRDGYKEMNGTLRSDGWASDDVQRHIDQLDEMIDSNTFTDDMRFVRAIGSGVLPEGNMVGSVIEDKGYTSVSTEQRVVEKFYYDGGAVLDVLVPKGGHGWWVNEGEKELILARGGRYKVVSDDVRDGRRHLTVVLQGEGDGGDGRHDTSGSAGPGVGQAPGRPDDVGAGPGDGGSAGGPGPAAAVDPAAVAEAAADPDLAPVELVDAAVGHLRQMAADPNGMLARDASFVGVTSLIRNKLVEDHPNGDDIVISARGRAWLQQHDSPPAAAAAGPDVPAAAAPDVPSAPSPQQVTPDGPPANQPGPPTAADRGLKVLDDPRAPEPGKWGTGSGDFRYLANADQRAASVWQYDYQGMGAVRSAIRGMQAGDPNAADTVPLDEKYLRRKLQEVENGRYVPSDFTEEDLRRDIAESARFLTEKMATEQETVPELHRGMAIDVDREQLLGMFAPGSEIPASLSSWTADESEARRYTEALPPIRSGRPVVMTMRDGQAFNLSRYSAGKMVVNAHSQEHISDGAVRVTNVREDDDGTLRVDVEHVGRGDGPAAGDVRRGGADRPAGGTGAAGADAGAGPEAAPVDVGGPAAGDGPAVAGTGPVPAPEIPPELTDRENPPQITQAYLQGLSDDELAALVGNPAVVADPAALDRVMAELDRRDAEQQTTPSTSEVVPGDEPTMGMSQDEVEAYWQRKLEAEHSAEQAGLTSEEIKPPKRKTRSQEIREDYELHVHQLMLDAEQATRGNMFSDVGKRAGASAYDLFSGDIWQSIRYASPELREWWQQNHMRRISFPEFRSQANGQPAPPSVRRAAELRQSLLETGIRGYRAPGRDKK